MMGGATLADDGHHAFALHGEGAHRYECRLWSPGGAETQLVALCLTLHRCGCAREEGKG